MKEVIMMSVDLLRHETEFQPVTPPAFHSFVTLKEKLEAGTEGSVELVGRAGHSHAWRDFFLC